MAETLYVLQLEDGKYYVGKTTNLKRRINEHCAGTGSEWTKQYAPKKVLEQRPLKDAHDENTTTKELMKKYGIENVRGGSYCQVDLPTSYKETLQAEIRSAEDACFKCGGKGHFARQCPLDCGVEYVWQCSKCTCEFSSERTAEVHEASCGTKRSHKTPCGRCGRSGHAKADCYTYTTSKGVYIGKPPRDPYGFDDTSSEEEEEAPKRRACYRCGRTGHYSPDCYASRHKKGYELD